MDKKIPMLDILRHDVESSGGDFNQVYSALKQGIDGNKMRIMRSGNTLLIYTIQNPGLAEVHISTMDEPKKLIDSVKDLYQSMLKAGFKTAVSTIDNPQMLRVVQNAEIPVKVQQVPTTTGKPQYQIIMGEA